MRSSKAEVDRSHALTGDAVEYAGIYATDHSILTLKGVRVKVSIIANAVGKESGRNTLLYKEQ